MEIIQALLEDNEKILWKKEFPPINLILDKRVFFRYAKIFLICYLPFMIFSLLLILFTNNLDVLKYSLLSSLLVIGIIVPYLIINTYKEKGKIYNNMVKIYPDEILQNYIEINLITNKNIICRWHSEWLYEFEHDYNEKIKHFARYKKDFLIINHQYLKEISPTKSNKKYDVYAYFYSPGVYKRSDLVELGFEQLTVEELNKFLKILLEIRNDIIIKPQY